MDKATTEQVLATRRGAGIGPRDTYAFIRITGPDAASWLQTQTSNDVLALESGQGHANAHLDRKAHVIAFFTLHRWEDEYWLLTEKSHAPRLLESLDAHLFAEQVHVEDATREIEQIALQGPRAPYLLATLLTQDVTAAAALLPQDMFACKPVELLGHRVLVFRITSTGEDGYVLATGVGEGAPLTGTLLDAGARFGVARIGPQASEIMRIEAGIPKHGIDYTESNRLPETTLERHAVSYTKGCYLGQEVVAKLKTYGSVKYALVGLELPQDLPTGLAPGAEIYLKEVKIGWITSFTFSPSLGRPIAMAYIDRDHRVPGTTLQIALAQAGPGIPVTITALPFIDHTDRDARAKALYEEALARFERDHHDEDTATIELLKEAILLAPAFEDAYECLGVILNRHHRVDEAIHYMKLLAQLNPQCVMAHTNLSVFYMAKGLIEQAEMEKAQATILQFAAARGARAAKELATRERERIRQEALERIRMFQEVLEIDPNDPLATFGMGAAYMQLNDYEKAIPFLERATQTQKDYSAAYLNLGKCLEFLGRRLEAARVYRAGIEAASRKGDLMPMREMERRVASLGLEVAG